MVDAQGSPLAFGLTSIFERLPLVRQPADCCNMLGFNFF
jgi:hypothetical protein